MKLSLPANIAIYLILLSPHYLSAQELIDTLDQVVITAQRFETNSLDIPATLSVYSQEIHRDLNPRSMAEALMGVPGVWIQKTNHGGGSPFIRGLTGNQTLLLLDGIRLNNSTYRYGPNQYLNTVDPLTLGRVEVFRGSASVQYGSDALGGAVHILSESLEFTDSFKVGGRIYGKLMADDGFTERMEATSRGEVEISSNQFALRLGGSLKDFGNLIVGGDSLQAFSSYQEQDYDAKALIQLSQTQQLTLMHQRVNQEDVGRFDQVFQRGREFFFFDPQRRTLSYINWKIENSSPWIRQIQTRISYQTSLEERRQKRIGIDEVSREKDEVRTWGVSVELLSEPRPQWTILSGIEYYGDRINSKSSTENLQTGQIIEQRGLYPNDARAFNYALFSLHTWRVEKWKISGGLRLNGITLDAEDEEFGDLALSPWALVGNLGLGYRLSLQHRLFASFNTGFRAPNINDISSFGSFDSGIEVPNDNLASERSLSWELGYKALTPRYRAQVALYHTQLRDLIIRVPTTFRGSQTYQGEPVFQKENVDKALIQGIEGQFDVFLPHGSLYTYLTLTTGEDEEGNPLRRIPPLNGKLGITHQILKNKGSLRAEFLYAGKQDRLSGGDERDHRIPEGGTPGWAIANIYGSYTLHPFTFHLGLQNLTDELYRMHGSGVDGYGRSLWIQLAYAW